MHSGASGRSFGRKTLRKNVAPGRQPQRGVFATRFASQPHNSFRDVARHASDQSVVMLASSGQSVARYASV